MRIVSVHACRHVGGLALLHQGVPEVIRQTWAGTTALASGRQNMPCPHAQEAMLCA